MQINSISSTNFGLIVDPSINPILDKSKKEVAKQGKKELDLWRRNIKTLNTSAPDDYTLYAEDYSKIGLSKPYEIKLEIPNGCKFTLKKLGNDEILDRSAIKDIKKQIRDQKKHFDDPNTIYCFF